MQASRDLVQSGIELAARVQFCVHDFHTAQARAGHFVYRHPASVVAHFRRMVGIKHNLDVVAKPRQGLINRVIDDFPQAVHESSPVGRADIHSGTLAHRLQPLQDGKVVGGVIRDIFCCNHGLYPMRSDAALQVALPSNPLFVPRAHGFRFMWSR